MRLHRPRRRADRYRSSVACHAPFSSMYLDQRGMVRACCQNDFHLLGNVTEQPLLEIWRGPRAATLRRAMASHDLSLGCDFCAWQVNDGRPELAYARWFDELALTGSEPRWPTQLELALSNTCNLQCVMCDGEWSSSIRSHRDQLPPLPKVYGDRFFTELEEFIPHLNRVKFLGGEPFLAAETMRVIDLLVDAKAQVDCHVTTNGTQWTPRVERALDALPMDVSVSVDAATAETYERIRRGSSWAGLQANLDRYQDHCTRNGRSLTLTFCLMTSNWQEFAGFCQMADDRGLGCAVNTVRHPHELSLYQLAVADLEVVVAGLEAADRARSNSLGVGQGTWDGELTRLRSHLDDRRSGRTVASVDTWRENPVMIRPFQDADSTPPPVRLDVDELRAKASELRDEIVGPGVARIVIDRDGVAVAVDPKVPVLDIEAAAILGRNQDELQTLIADHHGAVREIEQEDRGGGFQVVRVRLADDRVIDGLVEPAMDDDGTASGTWLYLRWSPRVSDAAPET